MYIRLKKNSYEFVLVDILAPQEKINFDKLTLVHLLVVNV